jgi:hypothetical protein
MIDGIISRNFDERRTLLKFHWVSLYTVATPKRIKQSDTWKYVELQGKDHLARLAGKYHIAGKYVGCF